jgi:hypothetical protein
MVVGPARSGTKNDCAGEDQHCICKDKKERKEGNARKMYLHDAMYRLQ